MGKCGEGYCQICGEYKELSFEHVPPRGAYNDTPVVAIPMPIDSVASLASKLDGPTIPGYLSNKGSGTCTLCTDCNNFTGGSYGGYFVDAAKQIYQAVYSKNSSVVFKDNRLQIPLHDVVPARILKQIVAMFASIYSSSGKLFAEDHRELSDYLLSLDAYGWAGDHAFFMYFQKSGYARLISNVYVTKEEPSEELLSKIDNAIYTGSDTISEFAFGFLGYIWARGDSIAIVKNSSHKFLNITGWRKEQEKRDLIISLPSLTTFPPQLPMTYAQ